MVQPRIASLSLSYPISPNIDCCTAVPPFVFIFTTSPFTKADTLYSNTLLLVNDAAQP
nr:MAG TPA: hypothetical protein [Caudoviricetes sp.]DAH00489.1 MAG TPA: hypothetical protein [Crassvirales sp.]